MISSCGLDCEQCPAFVATLNNDDALRVKVAKEWAEAYGAPVTPEDINCTGCHSNGVKVAYCEHMCEVRKCASQKNFQTCAECDTYPCANLNQIFQHGPQAKETLDRLRVR